MKPSTKNIRIEDLSPGQRPYGDTYIRRRLRFWQTYGNSDEPKPWHPSTAVVKGIVQSCVRPFKEIDDPDRSWADTYINDLQAEARDTFVVTLVRPFTD